MAFHGIHQVRHRRLQAFPTDTVGGFPDHDHRFSNGRIVDALASCRTRCILIIIELAEQPDAVLAVVAGNRDELVQDSTLVPLGRVPVTVSQCRQ